MPLRRCLCVIGLLCFAAPAAASAPVLIAAGLDAPRLESARWVQSFYERRGSQPAWQDERCETLRSELLSAIDASASHGLDPADYHREALAGSVGCAPHTEVLASDAWLSLARHLREGRIDPLSVSPHWTLVHEPADYAALLEDAVARGELAEVLDSLAPAEADYGQLRRALMELRAAAERVPTEALEEGPLLRSGDRSPRVLALRGRLQSLGWLDATPWAIDEADEPAGTDAETHGGAASSLYRQGFEPVAPPQDLFDEALAEALKAFQRSANLEPDGILGPRTLTELRRGPVQRIDQLRVNLERWRWLPRALGPRHIRVNIADFRLQAWGGGRVEREHAVIVGSHFRPTPSFSASLSYVVLNPDWVVPRKLAVQDKLPLFRRDPAAFDRLGFELHDREGSTVDAAAVDWHALSKNFFPYRLLQRPGPANALGQVKLILPNPHHVYLHDTPTRGLFSRVRRDFSSGCIRVEDALGLTEWALQGTRGFDRAAIDAAVASGARTRIDLAAPLPVHLFYITTPVAADGSIRFVADLYGQDERVRAALDSAAAR
jgi:murein L,D-transpeptidase YcbB/YkuD